jgi:predicted nucleotidyltransferase component of viral defense system
MLSIEEIKKSYPKLLHSFDRSLVREYLQYQLLALIFKHSVSRKLSFLGGTNLRIIYNLPRFSEDIDFDNKDLSFEEFSDLSRHIEVELERRGFLVENKLVGREAFHCYIKFPDLLYLHGISPIREEKILIQIDTFNQGVQYEPETFILNKFEIFEQILVTPKSVILSQKLWTITQRKRLKGRDFYDIMFLLQNTKPDLVFLKAKFNTSNLNEVRKIILAQLKDADYGSLIKDLSPFLQHPNEAEKIKLFSEFIKQELR